MFNLTFCGGLKESLFNVYLLRDASHLLISTSLILLSIWVYTGSLTLTLASLSSILLSLGRYLTVPLTLALLNLLKGKV